MAVQTQIQTRRGTAASWTSTNPTLAAGEIGFESDTNKFKIGTGSTAWASLPYASNVSPLTTKGDLYTFSTANARLAVGNNGETLVADSSTTTGLRWQGDYAAGKNKIINGDFRFNQRAFTSTTSNSTYGFDRWMLNNSGDGTNTYSAQTFTLGAAPVAGYEAINFVRLDSTGQTSTASLTAFSQRLEDVRTFAGQTITVSFWAKASSGTPNIVAYAQQAFGAGGSTSVNIGATTAKQAITTSWARYSFVISVPSISGKTIGSANSYLAILLTQSAGSTRDAYTDSLGIQSVTIDYWGVQVEAGSVATAFQTATGTIQGELAACQRYYVRSTATNLYSTYGLGYAYSTTSAAMIVQFPVTMRTAPSSVDFSNLALEIVGVANYAISTCTISGAENNSQQTTVITGATGLTQYRPYSLHADNTTSSFLGFSAEL